MSELGYELGGIGPNEDFIVISGACYKEEEFWKYRILQRLVCTALRHGVTTRRYCRDFVSFVEMLQYLGSVILEM